MKRQRCRKPFVSDNGNASTVASDHTGGSTTMELRLDRHSKMPLYLQLVSQLRAQIASGRLGPQYQLPPERELAEALGVNRSTIVQVYQRLRQEGLTVSHVGKGTFVDNVDGGQIGGRASTAPSVGRVPAEQPVTADSTTRRIQRQRPVQHANRGISVQHPNQQPVTPP